MKARRIIVVVLLIIVSLGWSIADLRRVLGAPLGDFGFATSDGIVTKLDANGPAARAGIALGDRNGADIDPDEEAAIAPLGINAAIALAYVDAQTLRARLTELEARFAYS